MRYAFLIYVLIGCGFIYWEIRQMNAGNYYLLNKQREEFGDDKSFKILIEVCLDLMILLWPALAVYEIWQRMQLKKK